MSALVAKLFVPVALIVAAYPAAAFSGEMGPTRMSVGQNTFYDDHYGPFYNGYWSASNDYYFSTGRGKPYIRDDGGHFRRVMISGFHPVEGSVPLAISEGSASR